MREKGLEPSRLYRHKILSLACLPIPAFPLGLDFLIKATTRFELVIRVLQTHALPLGYVAVVHTFGQRPEQGSNL